MILFNFDVLARPGPELGARLPDPDGLRLWNMMYEQTLGRLAVVVDQDVNIPIFEHWLKVHGIKAAMYEVLDTDDPDMKAEKVHRLSMTIGKSDWYIDVDPHTASRTLRLGIPTLLVASPYVIRPEWVEEPQTRAWATLVEEIDRQAVMRAERTWGDGPERGDE